MICLLVAACGRKERLEREHFNVSTHTVILSRCIYYLSLLHACFCDTNPQLVDQSSVSQFFVPMHYPSSVSAAYEFETLDSRLKVSKTDSANGFCEFPENYHCRFEEGGKAYLRPSFFGGRKNRKKQAGLEIPVRT